MISPIIRNDRHIQDLERHIQDLEKQIQDDPEMVALSAPLIIKDDKYFIQPSSDRQTLADMIAWLATKISEVLARDRIANKRYACGDLILSNKVIIDDFREKGRTHTGNTEYFKAQLPLEKTTWNDLDCDDIQLKIIASIVNVNDLYKWYKVRVKFSDFIDEGTKAEIDRLEDDEIASDLLKQSYDYHAGSSETNKIEKTNQCHHLINDFSEMKPTNIRIGKSSTPTVICIEEDDDDCQIINEVPAR